MSITTGTFPGVRIADMPDLGAFGSSSSVVGERAGSGRFSAVSIQAYMGAGIITQAPTGQFFVQDGARVSRVTDRLFVGPAAVNDGRYPNVSQDWLQAFLASSVGGAEVGPMVGATMSVLSINGQFGFVSGSRSSDNPVAGSTNTIGIAAYAINDNTTSESSVYAIYGEARRLSGVNDQISFAMELDVSNQGTLVLTTPYQQLPGSTILIQAASGCGVTLPGAQDTTAGLVFQANPTKFGAGIVFGATSIRGTDGVTGTGDAIVFAKGHTLSWFSSDGNETSKIQGNISDHTKSTILEFNDTGLTVQSATGGNLLVVDPVANTVNWVRVIGSVAGTQVVVAAAGADANIDLALVPQGTGSLNFGVPTTTTATAGSAGALPATVAGYATIKVGGVARKFPYYAP